MYVLLWISIFIISIILEFVSATALLTIWFCVGSLASIVTALLNLSFQIQVITFFIVSILFLIIFRPIALSHIKGNFVATNADRVIGSQTLLLEDITPESWGLVKISGVTWNVTTIEPSHIEKNSKVEILAIEGSKLIVKKI